MPNYIHIFIVFTLRHEALPRFLFRASPIMMRSCFILQRQKAKPFTLATQKSFAAKMLPASGRCHCLSHLPYAATVYLRHFAIAGYLADAMDMSAVRARIYCHAHDSIDAALRDRLTTRAPPPDTSAAANI